MTFRIKHAHGYHQVSLGHQTHNEKILNKQEEGNYELPARRAHLETYRITSVLVS